jgi:hypothetical protein
MVVMPCHAHRPTPRAARAVRVVRAMVVMPCHARHRTGPSGGARCSASSSIRADAGWSPPDRVRDRRRPTCGRPAPGRERRRGPRGGSGARVDPRHRYANGHRRGRRLDHARDAPGSRAATLDDPVVAAENAPSTLDGPRSAAENAPTTLDARVPAPGRAPSTRTTRAGRRQDAGAASTRPARRSIVGRRASRSRSGDLRIGPGSSTRRGSGSRALAREVPPRRTVRCSSPSPATFAKLLSRVGSCPAICRRQS